MVEQQAAPIQQTEPVVSLSLDWLVSNLRWLWLFLIAAFILGTSALTDEPLNTRMLVLVGIGAIFNALVAGLLWAKFFPIALAVISTIIDTILVVVLLYIAPDQAPYLLPLVLFEVVMAGVRWNTEVGLLVALAAGIGYAIPLIPLLQGEIDRQALIPAILTLGTVVATLIMAGTLPGFFVRQRVVTAQATNKAEIERLRIANERGNIISEMAMTLSSTLDYRKVLRATIDAAFMAMTEVGTKDESAIAMVLLFDDDGMLAVASGRNLSRKDTGRRLKPEIGIIGRTVQTAEATITHNAHRDKSVASFASTPGCRSAICAPLRAGFQTFGVVFFCSTIPNLYTQEHKSLLNTFCSQAIIALQNAQLFEDVHREQQKILEKESEARRKLARDLHDGPTQSVAAIVMRLNFIKMVLEKGDATKAHEEIVKVEEIAQRTTQEIRTMLFAMRPVILETQGLVPALSQYAERLNSNEDFRVRINNRGYEGQLNQEAEGVVFAIVEEAVGNAKKHAQASEIRITLAVQAESLMVEIRDDGVGFDVEETQSTYDQRTSLGLINMEERAELVGGRCSIESAKGKGASIKVDIPFQRSTEMGS